ncbi:hypothetical protein BS78_01G204500 [Paspalum vaginatum]|nr:hypothetical protein BS78_01G204500 [Paspalum vaginatum]
MLAIFRAPWRLGSSTSRRARLGTSSTVLMYLTFLEHKIGHLRGIICSAPRQAVSAELSCIAVQLNSLATSGGATEADEDCTKSPLTPPPCAAATHEASGDDSESSDHDAHAAEEDDDRLPPAGSYEVIELDRDEILAPHMHSCKVCGKGFKRDANLRMHMRGHGEEYKTAAALAESSTSPALRCLYSCPFVGCKRNREHRSFQPLKTAVCVKNHYRRSHCDKSYTCRRCNKHCGRDQWVCSCGISFSRKDKLFCHVATFDGHAPMLPPDDGDNAAADAAHHSAPDAAADAAHHTEAAGRMASMDECFSDCMFDKRGSLSPMGLDSCDFDGFDLFGAPGIDF